MTRAPVAIIGAGSWGTALAVHLAQVREVRLWCRSEDGPAEIDRARENRAFLPGVAIPPGVRVSDDLPAVLGGCGVAVLALPTQFLRPFLGRRRDAAWPAGPLVLASKGIEVGSLLLPADIVGAELGEPARARAVAFSGPSFAREVALGHPTAVVAACPDERHATAVQELFSHANLRVYTSPDRAGVQLAGALKNVVAIAAGVADGLGFGANATAALITRALAEISRLGVRLGSRRDTFMGLAGLGDLVLTCTGEASRNRQVGQQLGRGRALPDILSGMRAVAEGVDTCRAAVALGARHAVSLPIAEQVHEILFRGKDPRAALAELLARPLRAEPEDE
ncbi:MAG: NAD(P)-dependent glycerol-3-phosphate dehydrogenase [Acidobacteria bacterium]|nr:NAD(P)-dependent glycerol-3-phosphate dehydrogenase [Acidobacteriota bacterium]